MKRANILLGFRRVKKTRDSGKGQADADMEEDDWDPQDQLLNSGKVAIADDVTGYQLFGDSIFCAPQEDLLEDFYLSLGSPRLSFLIKEKYETSGEIPLTKEAARTRALILERLPLFLHEHTHARTRVSFNWLRADNNFVVKMFGKLRVTKSLFYGDMPFSRSQDASAVAKQDGRGPIQLWLAGHTQVDMYEVSTSLCRFLFESPRVSDALLFMTILDTPLKALRARGYNVDRILRQQKAERDAAERTAKEKRELEEKAARAEREATKRFAQLELENLEKAGGSLPPVPVSIPSQPPPQPATQASASSSTTTSILNEQTNLEKNAISPTSGGDRELITRPASQMFKSLNNFGRKLIQRNDDAAAPSPRVPNSSLNVDLPSNSHSSGPSSLPHVRTPTPTSQPNVTPLSNIASNIDMAIKACQEETSSLLRNREQMQMVKESLNEGYCDVSGRAGDLDLVGTLQGFKVYAAHDIIDRETLVQRRTEPLMRFIPILDQLRAVYNLPMSSLHIFCDATGQLIAFNRNGSLFVNLRYYEAWHDEDVRKGDLSKAFISWFFTLAHEIAHNLVQPHNSEHEFYFSSICEQYLIPLARILPSPKSGL
ncbi:hypothetical protein EW146_g8507 [Bondarzewia mesenterica]|uniref:Uncharacterized protein n=1 Tax=Bondarzewia mesenterica TaxID=1095465 RepID=A0A4S4LED3_9AGAM|nr:hypothetical protein EW146_g8507 [Bondarzewia mesenterica]